MKTPIFCALGLLILLGCGCSSPTRRAHETGKVESLSVRATELREHVGQHPDDIDAKLELARLYLDERLPYRALTEARDAAARQPGDVRIHLLLALVWRRLENFDHAAQALETALQLAPENSLAHLGLAYVYRDKAHQRGGAERESLLRKAEAELIWVTERASERETLLSAHLGLSGILGDLGDAERSAQHHALAQEIEPALESILRTWRIERGGPRPVVAPSWEQDTHPAWDRRLENVRDLLRGSQDR